MRALNLPENDSLVDVKPLAKEEILLVTKLGQAIRFNSSEDEVRAIGRNAYGVAGIKLDKDDEVVSLEVLPVDEQEKNKSSILTITTKGYGKRSEIEEYRKTGRAGKGVINIKLGSEAKDLGKVVTTVSVRNEDSVIITTAKGMVIRVPVKGIRIMGRSTQGVRIVKLQEQDNVTDLINVSNFNGEES